VARRGNVEGARAGQGRPADACPYARPFAADFDDCPAYHPAWFTPLTTGYDAMTPVWTCSNLVPGALPVAAARFYGRCRIGDAAARRGWVDALHARRLAGLRRLAVELTGQTAALTGELMEAKGAQLQAAAAGGAARDEATARLRDVAARWMGGLDAFLARRGGELAALGFPPDAIRALCADLIDTWVAQEDSAPPQISDETLRLFPEDVRVLLDPNAGGDAASEAVAEGQ